jgi:hypothetical protein
LFRDELVREIRFELASRYLGTEARIREALKYDHQFGAALEIINNAKSYNKLLKTIE